MRSKLMWAVLLLAAVFFMHGPTYVAAQQTPGGVGSAHSAAEIRHSEPLAANLSVVSADAPAAVASADVGEHSTDLPSDHDAVGHGALVHALMICLAVLGGVVAVTLTAMALWLTRRRTRMWVGRAQITVQTAIDHNRSLLPSPEFSRLCVLRI